MLSRGGRDVQMRLTCSSNSGHETSSHHAPIDSDVPTYLPRVPSKIGCRLFLHNTLNATCKSHDPNLAEALYEPSSLHAVQGT